MDQVCHNYLNGEKSCFCGGRCYSNFDRELEGLLNDTPRTETFCLLASTLEFGLFSGTQGR